MRTLLTIAGFDPSSGAGITADLAVMAAFSAFGTSCITALTVQSTLGVRAVHPVAAGIVSETLACLAGDLPPAGIKIGMLATAEVATSVANFLDASGPLIPVVLDPVVRSSSGRPLLDEEGMQVLRARLLRRVNWITPNRDELALLAQQEVHGPQDVERAVQTLQTTWPHLNVIATGGHLDRPDDYLAPASGPAQWLPGEWIPGNATHGTGCAFSTALLCGLVEGLHPTAAALQAKHFVAQAIRQAEPRGAGKGPMELLWPLRL